MAFNSRSGGSGCCDGSINPLLPGALVAAGTISFDGVTQTTISQFGWSNFQVIGVGVYTIDLDVSCAVAKRSVVVSGGTFGGAFNGAVEDPASGTALTVVLDLYDAATGAAVDGTVSFHVFRTAAP